MDKAIEQIRSSFQVEEKSVGTYETIKKRGMSFHIRWFEVKGLGNLSILTATGMFGLMKMDTLILTPFEKDLPLFSYDRMQVLGKDTFLLEYYDTFAKKEEAWEQASRQLIECKQDVSYITDYITKEHWYDKIELPETIKKSGKAKDREVLHCLFEKEWKIYLNAAKQMPFCSELTVKKEKTSAYVNGLFDNGGPSTDLFVKMIGKENAVELFTNVIFGTNH